VRASLFLLLIASCSSDVDTYCDRTCAKKALCMPGVVDKTMCSNDCKEAEQTVIPLVRSDYLHAYLDCIAPVQCTNIDSCEADARKKITASAAVQSFCMQYLPAATACSLSVYPDQATCVDRLEIYTDPTIENARACLTKPCTELGFCVKSETVPP
jgi:hypothetical protein